MPSRWNPRSVQADAAPGLQVAEVAYEQTVGAFGDRLVALYVIGSLAHGGFAPAVSDIDLAALVDHCDASVPPLVASVVEATRGQLGPGLADRLSIFYGDWASFNDPPETARMGAIDRLDLIDHGILMHGVDDRTRYGVRPSREQVIADTAAFLPYWLTQRRSPRELVAAGPRVLTKNVLFPVRFLYTHATGSAGANHHAVNWYDEQGRPHAELATAALEWRTAPLDPVAARALLDEHLDGLYRECEDAYRR
jgi:hypothetical protein